MAQTASISPADSDYVFEVLEDKSVSFRRADMEKPEARAAFMTFFHVWFQARLPDQQIDGILAAAPADWRYLSVKPAMKDGELTLNVLKATREPGKDSGDNAVITNIVTHGKH